MKQSTVILTDTSPAAASTAAGGGTCGIPSQASAVSVIAELAGATGGTLDVYIQTLINGIWYDWAHFTQLTSGGAAVKYSAHVAKESTIAAAPVAIGSALTPAIAVNTIASGAWGEQFRLVYVAGASTSAGAAQKVTLVLWSNR